MEIYFKTPLSNRLKNLRNPTNEKAVVRNKTDKPHTPKEQVFRVLQLKNGNDKSDNNNSKNPKAKCENIQKLRLLLETL